MVLFEFPYLTSVSKTPKALATRSGLSLALMQWCAMLTTLCTTALSWTTENHRPPPLETPSNRVKMLLKRPSSRMGTCKNQDQTVICWSIFFMTCPLFTSKLDSALFRPRGFSVAFSLCQKFGFLCRLTLYLNEFKI